jgi:hypothetical protein
VTGLDLTPELLRHHALYAVRDVKGHFKDIQMYKRAHGPGIKGKGKGEHN